MSYDDAVKKLQSKGQRNPVGRRFRQHRRDAADRRLDRPVMVDRYPDERQGVLFPACAGAAGAGAGRRFHRARRLRRNHRRRAAHSRSGSVAEAPGRSQSAARGIRLVYRSAQVRLASRTRDSAWAWSASWRGCAAWSTSARRSRSRGCCIGRGRERFSAVHRSRRCTSPPRGKDDRVCRLPWTGTRRGRRMNRSSAPRSQSYTGSPAHGVLIL